MRLTIVIPVYKEHLRFEESLRRVRDFLDATPETEVVFVDDGSPEESAAVIRRLVDTQHDTRLRLMRYPVNQGKGFAVRTGVLEAAGELILMSDADLSTPLADWAKLKTAIDAGADIACGSRAVAGAHVGKPPPLLRRILSKVFNVLVHIAGVRGIRDTQCGFKLFRQEAAREVFSRLRIRRFAFDVEMIARARDMGYAVAEVPVDWDYSGHSTVRVFSSGGKMLLDIAGLAIRRIFLGKYKR